jgi:hypothetical protein
MTGNNAGVTRCEAMVRRRPSDRAKSAINPVRYSVLAYGMVVGDETGTERNARSLVSSSTSF